MNGSTIVSLPEHLHMPLFGFREDGRTHHYLSSRCAYVSLFCPRPSSANDSTFPNMQILLHHAVYTPRFSPLKATCQKNALHILLRDICLDQHKFPLPISIPTPIPCTSSMNYPFYLRIPLTTNQNANDCSSQTYLNVGYIYIYMLVGCGEKGIGILYIARKFANFKSHFLYHYSTKRGLNSRSTVAVL